jgi:hypothetical protein
MALTESPDDSVHNHIDMCICWLPLCLTCEALDRAQGTVSLSIESGAEIDPQLIGITGIRIADFSANNPVLV